MHSNNYKLPHVSLFSKEVEHVLLTSITLLLMLYKFDTIRPYTVKARKGSITYVIT